MLVLWVSNICNSRCPHCPFNLHSELRQVDKNKVMPEKVFKRIAWEAGQYGSLIRITGLGEPLLNQKIIDLVEYAIKQGARIGFITNGALLNPEKIDRLLKAGIDLIEVSVDAMDKKTYSKIRIGLDFDSVKRNIELLMSRKRELKAKTIVAVSVINQPDKLKDPQAVVDYWKNKVDTVIFRKWITWNVLDQANFTEPFLDKSKRVPCPWPFDRLHINSDGLALFCADDLKRNHVVGDVNRKKIYDIWNGKKFESYRKYHLDRKFDKIDICAKCADWPYKSWKYNYFKVLKSERR
ncbi:MAG: radical SAM protein [Candidatus Portnoybacteria bacterium]|nr:radical SAM protein [Candidatus Portnoybacteria bacterium]MDD4982473.1 radical SAM protein [Candidatus Portnoybacteria bacterium]